MVRVVMTSVVLPIIVMHLRRVFIAMLTVFMVSVVVLKIVAPPSPRTDTPTLQPQVGSAFSAKKKFFRMSQKWKKISATCWKMRSKLISLKKMQLIDAAAAAIAKNGYLKQLAGVKCFMTVGQRV
jgi:hypothetical protein